MRTTTIRNPRGYEKAQARKQSRDQKTLNVLSRNILRYVESHGKALWARSVFELYYELACEQVLHGTGLLGRYKETQHAMLHIAVSMLVQNDLLVHEVDPDDYSVVVAVPAPPCQPAPQERTVTPVASPDETSLFRYLANSNILKRELLAHG